MSYDLDAVPRSTRRSVNSPCSIRPPLMDLTGNVHSLATEPTIVFAIIFLPP